MGSMRSLSCVLLVIGVLVSACTTKKKLGDACRASSNEIVCADAKSVGSCRNFTWHVDPCRGPGGCSSGVCDQSVASANDSCGVEGARACSTDGSSLLRCANGTMVPESVCRGEKGCYRASPNAAPSCDLGPPQLGDACTSNGGGRCSPDGKAVYQCSQQTHHIILERNCLGPKGCFKNPHFHEQGHEFLACDVAAGDVGQPCEGYAGHGGRVGNGGSFCSTDGTQLLTCKEGTLVLQRPCACSVDWAADLGSYHIECADAPNSRTHTVRGGSAAYLTLAETP